MNAARLCHPTLLLFAIFGLIAGPVTAEPREDALALQEQTKMLSLHADAYGKSAEPGGTAEYEVQVVNSTNQPTTVALSFKPATWAAMTASVEPSALNLAAGESQKVLIRVKVPERIPTGGHETQILRAATNGAAPVSTEIRFVTACKLEHPYIMHTAKGWAEVRQKVKDYNWAKDAQQDYIARAEKWNVPAVNKQAPPQQGDWLFRTDVEHDLMAVSIAYQLTLEKRYAEKARAFLLRLSDPSNGFPVTRRACNQASVQEGHFFQHVAMAYDMTVPSGLFTDSDRRQVETTLRLFAGTEARTNGQISNWNVSSLIGGLYCALDLQDMAAADSYLHAHGAIIDQLREGTLDDGWWYELSISYNTWVASEFSQVAIAMEPWGLDLANSRFPGAYRPAQQRVPEKTEYGITDAKWGSIQHNWISIKRMWDVLPRMVDYRGVMFGLNDSTEMQVAGHRGEVEAQPLEIAYYLYHDPAYATLIKNSGCKRDLLYGVPELPENTPDLSGVSTYSDNAGVAVLRSQAAGKPPRERIQAVLRYGDHGWYHGHFDIADMVHLSRYGRSFFNPEMIWYGYGSYLYKFYVQTSISKNMVVVDQKQQEPAENQRLLFHSGKLMQVSAVQVRTRWSNPPYGGMVYDEKKSFEEQAFGEGRSIPLPRKPPTYGRFNSPTTSLTGYTEPVLQRRLMIVTDDYVVLADYLKGEREHTFDSLFQMKGFQELDGHDKILLRHTGQWSPDPIGSAQFVTDCDWYGISAPARGSFRFRWGEAADNSGTRTEQNEPGVLNLDVHTLWPPRQEIMIGTAPEFHPVQRIVAFAVRGDGKPLAEGKSGIWILGEQHINVPLGKDMKTLELETRTAAVKPGTLFWADAVVVTADGKEMPLTDLLRPQDSEHRVVFENTAQPTTPGKDFEGGPVKIAGIPYERIVSAQPQEGNKPALIRVNLSGLNAVRFKAVLGGDFPNGDEAQRRKTVAVRSRGQEARFLTLIEPFENQRMVKNAMANDADRLRIELADGRVQEIKIANLAQGSGNDISVRITETKGADILRAEATDQATP